MIQLRMIQLPQENLIPGFVCILLERKPLPVTIFYEFNSAIVRLLRTLNLNCVSHVKTTPSTKYQTILEPSISLCLPPDTLLTKSQVSFVVHEGY